MLNSPSVHPKQSWYLIDRDSYIKGDIIIIIIIIKKKKKKTYEWLNDNVVKSHNKKNE